MTRSASAIGLQKGVKPITEDVFAVTSGSDPTRCYVVTMPDGSCNCADFTYRQTECKHQWAVRFWLWGVRQ